MPLPVTFANLTEALLSYLDDNFAALGALTPIPCTITGTNTISLAANSDTPTVAAYSNYMQFSGVAANTNTGAATAQVDSLSALNVYKDTPSGPVVLTGGEIVSGCLLELVYDSALNTGSGGFHLMQYPAIGGITHYVTTAQNVTFAAITPGAALDRTIALPGAGANDNVLLGLPAGVSSGLVFMGFVQATTSVILRIQNITAATTITPPTGTVRISALS